MVGLLNLAMPTVSVVFGDVGCWLFEFSLARSEGLGSFPRKEWGTRVFPQKAPKVGVFQCVSSCPVSLLPLTAVEPGGSGPVRGAVGPGDAVLLVHWTCCVYMAGVARNIIGLICSP